MPLKPEYADAETFETDVDAEYRDLYTEQPAGSGKWRLTGIEGVDIGGESVARLEGSLKKAREDAKALKARMAAYRALGEDPAEVQAEIDRLREEAAAGAEPGEDEKAKQKRIDAILEARLAPIRRDAEKTARERDEAIARAAAADQALRSRTVVDALTAAAAKEGVIQPAMKYVKLHASEFEIDDDGRIVSLDTASIGPGLSPEEYIGKVKATDAEPLWFERPRGGGMTGGVNTSNVANPWRDDSLNRTEQARILREKPAMAKALAAAAGKPLPEA